MISKHIKLFDWYLRHQRWHLFCCWISVCVWGEGKCGLCSWRTRKQCVNYFVREYNLICSPWKFWKGSGSLVVWVPGKGGTILSPTWKILLKWRYKRRNTFNNNFKIWGRTSSKSFHLMIPAKVTYILKMFYNRHHPRKEQTKSYKAYPILLLPRKGTRIVSVKVCEWQLWKENKWAIFSIICIYCYWRNKIIYVH